LTGNRRLGVRGGIELGKRRRVVPDGRLESRLSVSFIDELARVLGMYSRMQMIVSFCWAFSKRAWFV
jgi:hypothetical protein